MLGIKPEIKVTLFPRKNKDATTTPTNESVFDIAAAEEAATRIGKKLVLGAVVVSVATIAAATLGSLAITAFEHALEK